jgi:putative transposase
VSVYRFISAEKARTPVSVCCELLGVSRSGSMPGCAGRRAPSGRALSDAWLTEKIKAIHQANRGVYGARRIHAELRLTQGVRVGRKRVERLMRQADISGLVKRRKGRTTIRVPGVRVAEDLVARRFTPAAPNMLGSPTSPPSERGRGGSTLPPSKTPSAAGSWVGAMADHMRSQLVVDALQMPGASEARAGTYSPRP